MKLYSQCHGVSPTWARRLAGSPRLASPKGGPTGGDSLAGGSGPDQTTTRRQGARDKDYGTRDKDCCIQHDWFLGDHIPGGGIDLRAGGCALCVCSPLTLLYSYSRWIDRHLATSWGRPGEELLQLKPVKWIQPLRRCLLRTAFRRAQPRTTSKGWQPRGYDFAPPLSKCRPRRTAQTPLRFLLRN